jgi:hypothetical protein
VDDRSARARNKTLVASKKGVRMRALVPDGTGLLGMSSTPVTLHHIGGGDTEPIVVDDRAYGIALCRVGSTAFIGCDDRVICSIDPVTHAVTRIVELPKAASHLASDGKQLYTLHRSAIGSVDLATRSFTQCAGQPELGAGQMLAAGGGAARDGVNEGAVIESARFLSYDAGNLWFTDNGRLRRFEIKALHTRTLELG